MNDDSFQQFQCCRNCHCNCSKTKADFTENEKHTEKYKDNEKLKNKSTNTNFIRQCEKDNLQAKTQSKQMANNNNNKKGKTPRTRICMISGGVELVPLLARRRALQRPISLSTTDVTKHPSTNLNK